VVTDLATNLLAQPHFQSWIMDFTTDLVLKFVNRDRRMRRELANAPFVFGVDPELKFFLNLGWRAEEIRYMADEGRRLKRMPPRSFFWKFVLPLMPKKTIEKYRKMSGYANLSRT
jgi:hypothetical protein